MGFTQPFERAWRSVQAKLTANNVAIMFGSYPIILEESDGPSLGAGIEDEDEQPLIIEPMKILSPPAGKKYRVLEIKAVGDAAYRQIELELGAAESESPGKSNKNQSGFSQSMAEAFEELAMTTVHTGLGELYEEHGSFVLEAAKRLPEMGKTRGGVAYPPIMVFASTDVPVSDNAGEDRHNEPMELDPDLIDETFTTKAEYTKSMSIPEEQQAMEEVARRLMTRRDFLEKKGHLSPEMVELELLVEENLQDPEFKKLILWPAVRQVQGAEELAELEQAKQEGLANEAGMGAGLTPGVAPVPMGGLPPLQQGMPGVPMDGSVTGMAPPQYGPAVLGGVVGGAGMTGPINTVTQAGGVIPPNGLPGPGGL